MGIPLLQPYTDQERRYLTIAQWVHTLIHGATFTHTEHTPFGRWYGFYNVPY